jgi:Leucine-rich repeat (LRR) protein
VPFVDDACTVCFSRNISGCILILPYNIFLLLDLKILHCQNTQISAFPDGLHELYKLEELCAHHCRLQTIDGRIGLLPHLRVLDCTSNPVWSPPIESLSLDTPELKRVLTALAITQQPHAVASHIM